MVDFEVFHYGKAVKDFGVNATEGLFVDFNHVSIETETTLTVSEEKVSCQHGQHLTEGRLLVEDERLLL